MIQREQGQEDGVAREVVHYESLILGVYNPTWSKKKKSDYVEYVLENLSEKDHQGFINTLKELYPEDKFVKSL